MANDPPLIISAPSPAFARSATVIFLHGLGDDAYGSTGIPLITTEAEAHIVTDLVAQLHTANKLPHVRWILPNAPQNRDLMTQAWYRPRYNLLVQMPKREVDSEEEEPGDDEEGMMTSVEYVCGLIDKEVEYGVPPERLVVGGFSQGCAIALLVALMSRYKAQIAGAVGLSGNLPLQAEVENMMKQSKEGKENATRFFVAHGSEDLFVPMRYFRSYVDKLKEWDGDHVEAKVYEGMGHSTTGEEVKDLSAWLEKILPL